jgi:hypothetical protein
MNTKSKCLGWQFQTFKHSNSEEALIFSDFRICYSIYLYCNFQLGIFSYELGKLYTIFNWEYDPISVIK